MAPLLYFYIFSSCILILLKFGFQDHSSGSENDKNDSASQLSNQSDTGKQGLGTLGPSSAGHTAVKVGMGQQGAELSEFSVATWGESQGPLCRLSPPGTSRVRRGERGLPRAWSKSRFAVQT